MEAYWGDYGYSGRGESQAKPKPKSKVGGKVKMEYCSYRISDIGYYDYGDNIVFLTNFRDLNKNFIKSSNVTILGILIDDDYIPSLSCVAVLAHKVIDNITGEIQILVDTL